MSCEDVARVPGGGGGGLVSLSIRNWLASLSQLGAAVCLVLSLPQAQLNFPPRAVVDTLLASTLTYTWAGFPSPLCPPLPSPPQLGLCKASAGITGFLSLAAAKGVVLVSCSVV